MTDDDYKKIAVEELANKSLESTIYSYERLKWKKLFTIDDVKYVFRIADTEFVTVALPVSNKQVFLKVNVNTKSGNVEEVVIEAGNIVRLVALSKYYSLMEIKNMTGLIPTEGWSKGDVRGRWILPTSR